MAGLTFFSAALPFSAGTLTVSQHSRRSLKDPRYKWFIEHYGDQAWELDAMDPNDLRASVEAAIIAEMEPEAWSRCATTEKAERGRCEVRQIVGRRAREDQLHVLRGLATHLGDHFLAQHRTLGIQVQARYCGRFAGDRQR